MARLSSFCSNEAGSWIGSTAADTTSGMVLDCSAEYTADQSLSDQLNGTAEK